MSHYQIQNNLDYLQLDILKVKAQRNIYIVVPTVCGLSEYNISFPFHQKVCRVLIIRLQIMANKGLIKNIPMNISDLEKP